MMKTRLLYVAMVVLVVASASQAALITKIVRSNPDSNSGDTEPVIASPLAEDSKNMVDRGHEYNSIPAIMLGADYIKVANDDKDNPNYKLDVTMGSGTLLLMIDNRTGYTGAQIPGNMDDRKLLNPDLTAAGMTWVAAMGFVDTGLDIGIDENGNGDLNGWSSVFSLNVSAGTYSLLQQNDKIDAGARNMYGVAAIPEPMTLSLLALGGLLASRKRS